MLNRRCDLADAAHINPHRFRHTWAHLFRAEGGAGATTCMYLASGADGPLPPPTRQWLLLARASLPGASREQGSSLDGAINRVDRLAEPGSHR